MSSVDTRNEAQVGFEALIHAYVRHMTKALKEGKMLLVQRPMPAATKPEDPVDAPEVLIYGPVGFNEWRNKFPEEQLALMDLENIESLFTNLAGMAAMDYEGNVEFFMAQAALESLESAEDMVEIFTNYDLKEVTFYPVVLAPTLITSPKDNSPIFDLTVADPEGILVDFNSKRQDIGSHTFGEQFIRVLSSREIPMEQVKEFFDLSITANPEEAQAGAFDRLDDFLTFVAKFEEMRRLPLVTKSAPWVAFVYHSLLFTENRYIIDTANGALGLTFSGASALREGMSRDEMINRVIAVIKENKAEDHSKEGWERIMAEINDFLDTNEMRDVLHRRALTVDEVETVVWKAVEDQVAIDFNAMELKAPIQLTLEVFHTRLNDIASIQLNNRVNYEVLFATAPAVEHRPEFDKLLNCSSGIFPGALLSKPAIQLTESDLRGLLSGASTYEVEFPPLLITELFSYASEGEPDSIHLVAQVNDFSAGFQQALKANNRSFGSCVTRNALNEEVRHLGRGIEALSREEELVDAENPRTAAGVDCMPGSMFNVVYHAGGYDTIVIVPNFAEVETLGEEPVETPSQGDDTTSQPL